MDQIENIERISVSSRAEWLELRRHDVTASDIGALFGCHPYRSALQVYADKVGEGVDHADDAAMRAGRILEPGVAIAVAEERPQWKIGKANEYVRAPDLRLAATPDFYATDDRGPGILETKTADPVVFDRDWNGGPPIAWTLQCLVQMMLTGASWGAVAVLVRSRDFPIHIYDVPRHPDAERKIIEKVRGFWAAVETGTQPPADFTRDGAVLSTMFPHERGEPIDLSDSNRLPKILERRIELATLIRAAEAEKDAIDTELKSALGDAPEGRLPGWRVTWRTQHRKETIIPAKDLRVLRVSDLRSRGAA